MHFDNMFIYWKGEHKKRAKQTIKMKKKNEVTQRELILTPSP